MLILWFVIGFTSSVVLISLLKDEKVHPIFENQILSITLASLMSIFGALITVVLVIFLFQKKYDKEIYDIRIRSIKDLFLWNKHNALEDAQQEIKALKLKRKKSCS